MSSVPDFKSHYTYTPHWIRDGGVCYVKVNYGPVEITSTKGVQSVSECEWRLIDTVREVKEMYAQKFEK